jgi:hypothetical protein
MQPQALGKAPQAPPGWGPQRNVGPLVAMPPPNVPQQQIMRNGGWAQETSLPPPVHQLHQHQQAIVLPAMSVRAPIGVVGPPINAHLAQNIEQQRMLELQQQHNNGGVHVQQPLVHQQHNGMDSGALPQPVHQYIMHSNVDVPVSKVPQPTVNNPVGAAPVLANKAPQQPSPNQGSHNAHNNNTPTTNGASAVKPAPVIEPATATTTLEKLRKETNPRTLDMPPKNARYFVIKSYSEDDVHRSIKYGIWCSTEHGNKRLEHAFKQSLKPGQGPIYLFFSVNASGHFCGLAQMVSCVDYSKQSNVWGSDKYKGLFKVRWVYVKDVPNQQLRHIRLENNENKPVTNSRDTQSRDYFSLLLDQIYLKSVNT